MSMKDTMMRLYGTERWDVTKRVHPTLAGTFELASQLLALEESLGEGEHEPTMSQYEAWKVVEKLAEQATGLFDQMAAEYDKREAEILTMARPVSFLDKQARLEKLLRGYGFKVGIEIDDTNEGEPRSAFVTVEDGYGGNCTLIFHEEGGVSVDIVKPGPLSKTPHYTEEQLTESYGKPAWDTVARENPALAMIYRLVRETVNLEDDLSEADTPDKVEAVWNDAANLSSDMSQLLRMAISDQATPPKSAARRLYETVRGLGIEATYCATTDPSTGDNLEEVKVFEKEAYETPGGEPGFRPYAEFFIYEEGDAFMGVEC